MKENRETMSDVITNLDMWNTPGQGATYELEHQGIAGQFIYESETQPILDLIKRVKPTRMLDAGCGTGRHLVLIEGCKNLHAIDYSEEMLSVARKKVPSCTFACGSIHDTPYEDAFFDMLISIRVFQHIDGVGPVFCEFDRILKPGGSAHILVYNSWHVHSLNDKLRHSALARWISERAQEGSYWKRLYRSYYNRFYSPTELVRDAKKAGFENVNICGATVGMAWFLHSAGFDRVKFKPFRALLRVYISLARIQRNLFKNMFPFKYFFDTYVVTVTRSR